jgi:nucleoside phosphorylase
MRDVESTSRAIAEVLVGATGQPDPRDVAAAIDRSLSLQLGRSKSEIARMLLAQLPAGALREKVSASVDGVIFVATDLEFIAASKQLARQSEGLDQNGNWVLHGVSKAGSRILIVKTGQGNVASSAVTTSVLQQVRPPIAVFAGVAGGLHGQAIGSVVIASVVHDYESAEDSGTLGSRAKPVAAAHRVQQFTGAVARDEAGEKYSVEVRPIASGEKLVTDVESSTAQWLRVIASDAALVEMEGLGFMRAASNLEIPATVVRGISDHLGDKSTEADKANQPLAAKNATRIAIVTVDRYRSEKK